MVEIRRIVFGLHSFCGGCKCCLDIPLIPRDRRLFEINPFAQELHNAVATNVCVLSKVPLNRQFSHRLVRIPPAFFGNDGDGIFQRNNLNHSTHLIHFVSIHAFQPTTKHRTVGNRGIQHTWQLGINRKLRLASHFIRDIEPFSRLAKDGPVFGIFERRVLGNIELCSLSSHRAVTQLSFRWGMSDQAVGRHTLGDGYAPLLGRSSCQHDPGCCTSLAQILMTIADRSTPTRQHSAKNTIPAQVFTG